MPTYLITGGAGFIGSNIARELVSRGEKVIVFDNLSSGSMSNLADIESAITFVPGDIRDFTAITTACQGVDYVLHQAAIRAVVRSIDAPLEVNEHNITGTLNVLEAARAAKVKRVVFASSSSVYGDANIEQQSESLTPNPASPYALTKLTGEHYCRLYHELFGLSTVSLRYFNVFGPHQNVESQYSAVIPIFVDHLLHGRAPEIHWHGQQSRDFTYVANVVAANLRAAVAPTAKSGHVYNIGNGQTTTIMQLYQALQQLLDISIEPRLAPKRAGDILKTHADINRAQADLGYQPEVSFSEGLQRSIDWYRANLTVQQTAYATGHRPTRHA